MRVNIQYSIDTEELPEITGALIQKAIESIDMESIEKLARPYELLSLETAETIDTLRQALATTDALLQDAQNIIMGWVRYKSAEPSTAAASPPTIAPEELQAKLAAFKTSLDAQQTNEAAD